MAKTVKIKINDDLIKEAEMALEKLPQTATEQIEKWAYIGRAVSLRLTEREVVCLQLGTGKLVFTPNEQQ